jgi:uncharacterized protein YlxW (UPF0749 family)
MTEPRPTPPASDAAPTRVYAPDFLTELFRNPLDAGYSDAAERKQAAGGAVPLRRTGFLLRTIALVLTGLLLAVAYQQTVAAKPESTDLRHNLAGDVVERQEEAAAQQKTADQLRTQVTRLRDSVLVGSDAAALRNLEATVGVQAVTGTGAVISLADGPQPTDPVTGKTDTNPDDFYGRVLDSDLQIVANELWRDGAEAIAINGQRLTATSAIRIAGSAILVDFVPLSQPYQIVAIGPSDLASRFSASGTAAEYRRLHDTYGMKVSIDQRAKLTAPAAPDAALQYATPLRATDAASSPPGAPSPSTSGGR